MRSSQLVAGVLVSSAVMLTGRAQPAPHGPKGDQPPVENHIPATLFGPDDPGIIKPCDTKDGTPAPTKIYILHIPSTVLSDIYKGKVNCGPKNHSCVFLPDAHPKPNPHPTKNPNPGNPDDDDTFDYDNRIPGSAQPASKKSNSPVNWQTPFDIDLDPTGTGWKTGMPMLIKIVLDNPKYSFARVKAATADLPTPNAVIEGYEGRGMLRCLSRPRRIASDPSNRWFVTVRAFEIDPTKPTFGGLNIGILVPTKDASGKAVTLPIYIDPQIHSNG